MLRLNDNELQEYCYRSWCMTLNFSESESECVCAMWPVQSIQINWNGLSASQMFYISHDCMLFYHAHTHSLTHSLSLIQFNIKWKFRLLVQFENRRYCYTQRLLFRLFKVCTLMLYTFSNSVCTVIIVIILFCFAYPCIVQAIHTVVVSVCVLERASE